MLEVMSAGSTELSRAKGDRGMLLNCWDKSSPLIEELERTVNFAERKCGDLMQQLHFYKEYYEKWSQVDRVNHLCQKVRVRTVVGADNRMQKKMKKCFRETMEVGSSSENEFEKVNRYFYKKIKSKINEMSNEISEANRKMHSKSESPPPGDAEEEAAEAAEAAEAEEAEEAAEPSPLTIGNKVCKSEPTMTSSPVARSEAEGVKVTSKQSSKSVPGRNKAWKSSKRETVPGKRRYSNLQRYKLRSKSLPQGVRRKFGFGGFFEVFEPEASFRENVRSRSKSRMSLRADSFKSNKSRKSSAKSKTRTSEPRRHTPKDSRQESTKSITETRHCCRNARSEPDPKNDNSSALPESATPKEANTCKAIVPSASIPTDVFKAEPDVNDSLKNLIAKPNSLLPFLRHPIPFIPCSSTSKSFNLGLNVQQVLSLIKRKRHSVTLRAIVKNSMQAARSMTEPTVNTLFISQTTTSHSHVTSAICPAREGSEDGFSVVAHDRSKCTLLKQVQTMRSQAIEDKVATPGDSIIEISSTKLDRPEDVWVVDQPDSSSGEVNNVRSRCTCFPSKHCVDYHKVLRQYTGWRLPAGSHPDSRSSSSSSYLCTRSKLYAIPSQDDIRFPGGGGHARADLLKVHDDLLKLTRRYSSLQEQISQNCLDDYEANAELDAMESELALREVEFKDILRFYKQLMVLKEKLRSLRVRNAQSQPETSQVACRRPRRGPLRPTPSMALAKVLKKIQGLQDKINLIDTP